MAEYLHGLGTVHGALLANLLLWLSAWGAGRFVLGSVFKKDHPETGRDPLLVLPIGLTIIGLIVIIQVTKNFLC